MSGFACKVRPLLVRKEQKPPFPDTCVNPWWNASEKMQKKFLKYISLRPQYIPYASRVPGRGLARLATSGKCFSPTLGKSLSVLSYLTAGRNLRENAKCCRRRRIETAEWLLSRGRGESPGLPSLGEKEQLSQEAVLQKISQ